MASDETPNNLASQWIFDTGATSHMCSNANMFTQLRMETGSVSLADQSCIPIVGVGNVTLCCEVDNHITNINLTDVLYVPKLGRSLFSWRAVKRKNKCILIDNGILELKLKSNNRTFLQTRDVDNNFIVNTCQNAASAATYEYWHAA